MKCTTPPITRAHFHHVSIDEHVVPRFTRKFSIRKGYHTIRNKHMKVEKLSFAFHTGARWLLSLLATPGNVGLGQVALRLLPSLRRRTRAAQLRVILDAGAAHDHSQLFALADHPRQVTIVRVPRRRAYREQWLRLPKHLWREVQEQGPCGETPVRANPSTSFIDMRSLPDGCFLHWFFVKEWNALLRVAARNAAWRWTDDS